MEIDKERLDQLVFGICISSGSPVFIFYSPEENDFYTSIYGYKRHQSDEIVFEYDVVYRMNHNFDNLMDELSVIIHDFKGRAQIRDDKLGDLLK